MQCNINCARRNIDSNSRARIHRQTRIHATRINPPFPDMSGTNLLHVAMLFSDLTNWTAVFRCWWCWRRVINVILYDSEWSSGSTSSLVTFKYLRIAHTLLRSNIPYFIKQICENIIHRNQPLFSISHQNTSSFVNNQSKSVEAVSF